MTTKPKEQLILAAAAMVRSPEGKNFVEAYSLYTEEAREACINSPPEWLQYSQGAARHASILLKLLQTAPEEAEKIFAARAAKQNRSQT